MAQKKEATTTYDKSKDRWNQKCPSTIKLVITP